MITVRTNPALSYRHFVEIFENTVLVQNIIQILGIMIAVNVEPCHEWLNYDYGIPQP